MNGALMAAEMAEQPDVLAGLIARRRELASRVRGVLPSALAGIVLIARRNTAAALGAGFAYLQVGLAEAQHLSVNASTVHLVAQSLRACGCIRQRPRRRSPLQRAILCKAEVREAKDLVGRDTQGLKHLGVTYV